MKENGWLTLSVMVWITLGLAASGAALPQEVVPGDLLLSNYFQAETAKLSSRCLTEVKTLDDWRTHRESYRQQAAEMLGLWPMPDHTDLKPVVTGKIEREDFSVEKLHFQSRPGLYVTANLYLPKPQSKPAPTILYLCGHAVVVSNGVSYGNKVGYQHHGIWFARNGYVCLVMDTLQLGEIQGLHHGTYREGRWWWNSRGYSPAGVEAWNSLRALDYLCTRPEVDTNRFGVTGRSGGGSYSWTVAALDDRIKVAAPVAGITDLQNHVVDGAVEGHCDCMFFVNTYRQDYPWLAALCVPRPLLLVNTDSDSIFPLDGVMRTYGKLRTMYQLQGATNNLGLVIGPGPHKDTQDLQVPVFRWFNHHLQHQDPVITQAAVPLFSPQQLRVFDQLPADQINTRLDQLFVAPAGPPMLPSSTDNWHQQRDDWQRTLLAKTFAGWPDKAGPVDGVCVFSARSGKLRYEAYDFWSQPGVKLRLYLAKSDRLSRPERVVLRIAALANLAPAIVLTAGPAELSANTSQLDRGNPRAIRFGVSVEPDNRDVHADGIQEIQTALGLDAQVLGHDSEQVPAGTVLTCLLPRGFGISAWSGDLKKQTHIRRRFMLLGQTLDGMRVWDIRRGMQLVRSLKSLKGASLHLESEGEMAVNTLYAALYEPPVEQLNLRWIPATHLVGPDYLNVLKILDVPQVAAMVAEHSRLRLWVKQPRDWEYPVGVSRTLHWPRNHLALESLTAFSN
jgi:dienelactone hydrolase